MQGEIPVDMQGSRDEGEKLKWGFEENINVEICFSTFKCVIKRLIFWKYLKLDWIIRFSIDRLFYLYFYRIEHNRSGDDNSNSKN